MMRKSLSSISATWPSTKRPAALNPNSIRSRIPSKRLPWNSIRRWLKPRRRRVPHETSGVVHPHHFSDAHARRSCSGNFASPSCCLSCRWSVAATVRPLVDRFAARGLPRGLALLFTYALCVGGVIALVLILSGPLFD